MNIENKFYKKEMSELERLVKNPRKTRTVVINQQVGEFKKVSFKYNAVIKIVLCNKEMNVFLEVLGINGDVVTVRHTENNSIWHLFFYNKTHDIFSLKGQLYYNNINNIEWRSIFFEEEQYKIYRTKKNVLLRDLTTFELFEWQQIDKSSGVIC